MYKAASDTENFLSRTGSFSLRFRRTGDNSDLAGLVLDVSYTADLAADSLDIFEYFESEIVRRKHIIRCEQDRIELINKKLLKTMPKDKYEALLKEKKELNRVSQKLAVEIRLLKDKRRELFPKGVDKRGDNLSDFFIAIAKEVLPVEVFEDIRQQAIRKYKENNLRKYKDGHG